MAFAPGCFFGLLSAGFSRGGNFAEFQKMRAEGVLAKFAIARFTTLQKFRKCALRGSLLNLLLLGFTGTLGAAVCCKMLCYVGTLSAF